MSGIRRRCAILGFAVSMALWVPVALLTTTLQSTVLPLASPETVVGAPLSAENVEGSGPSAVLDGLCSCWNSAPTNRDRWNATDDPCCQRVAISGHKLGTVLTRRLFRPYPWIHQKDSFLPDLVPEDLRQDYRHVAIVRNLYPALVSGYLYHRSGRECWLNIFGVPLEVNRTVDWQRFLERRFPNVWCRDLGPYPPRNGRSICQYLIDESAEDGMKVYMAFVWVHWYNGVLPYLKRARDRTPGPAAGKKTLLVCLEEASDPRNGEAVFRRIMDWLYPGGHSFVFQEPVREAAGHGTSRNDPDQRLQLLELVKRLDRDVFGGVFRAMNSHFDCLESAR